MLNSQYVLFVSKQEVLVQMDSSLQRPDGVVVTYRRMRFDFEEGFDRYWHGGSAFRSLFWTQLSTSFQPGERFFIDSARALKGVVDDPALLDELGAFCRQEGHHTAQHLKFDEVNAAMGIDVEGCRARFARSLSRGREIYGPVMQLGVTCALEHFTSGCADMLFATPDIAEGADPRVQALWTWHAIEEAEHRATCFDIFEAAGGTYTQRVTALVISWLSILLISLINTAVLLSRDGRLWTWDTAAGLWYLFGTKGVVTRLVPTFLAYFRPGFYPWEEGATVDGSVIRAWQERNAAHIVYLDAPTAAAL